MCSNGRRTFLEFPYVLCNIFFSPDKAQLSLRATNYRSVLIPCCAIVYIKHKSFVNPVYGPRSKGKRVNEAWVLSLCANTLLKLFESKKKRPVFFLIFYVKFICYLISTMVVNTLLSLRKKYMFLIAINDFLYV